MEAEKSKERLANMRETSFKAEENYGKCRSNSQKTQRRKELKSSEDVCFICLDGGDLVLCEQGSCAKAYHQSCVNRDEEYFEQKGTWICGWHLCNDCGNQAKFFCYTCETSYCKVCINEADFILVKKTKGLCEDCFKLVNMIEENKNVDSEGNEVDFTDKGTYEFLFKDYWLELKDKHSLTLADPHKAQIHEDDIKDDTDSERILEKDNLSNTVSGKKFDLQDEAKFKEDKRKQLNTKRSRYKRSEEMECQLETKSIPLVKNFDGWASKELIELIAYLGEETKNPFSWVEVKNLLLKYISKNKLKHPFKRNHVLCDPRLYKLFGKDTLRLPEMYKLLESHIMPKQGNIKDEPQRVAVTTDDSHMDMGGNKVPIDITKREKRHKLKKNADGDKGLTENLNEFATINMHNVRLIYLQRGALEDLLEDLRTFSEKVTGSFVRIRLTGTRNQRMLCHRLVQVVGTKKVQKAYITERKTTDLILEILNLDKEEYIFINEVSNHDFTEVNNRRRQNQEPKDNRSAVGTLKAHRAATHTVDRPTRPTFLRDEPEEEEGRGDGEAEFVDNVMAMHDEWSLLPPNQADQEESEGENDAKELEKLEKMDVHEDEKLKEALLTGIQQEGSFRMHGVLAGQKVIALLDTGATHNFIDARLVER
ncbi:zinc finger CCCH domain-containing protein 19 [Cryptomeria japonica]|uniref:zinc finger CCCH domain-containing protein 19 n=1 Tax=Cryptomeria japonica TaxID=3369 RepID=UPI0027DA7565|nr:zinc finger CCCH domain-containing protein 19 [Cryptomeria japonica]